MGKGPPTGGGPEGKTGSGGERALQGCPGLGKSTIEGRQKLPVNLYGTRERNWNSKVVAVQ